MGKQRKNGVAVASIAVCTALVCVGLVRVLSYSRGALGESLRHSPVGLLCYDPSSRLNAQFFKVLATPSVVAAIYFFFRWHNAGIPRIAGDGRLALANRLDFDSPVLRGILTTVITLHWLAMEWWKFHVPGFYPWSPLESRWLSIAVLLAGQALAFWGMKYLSFDPVTRDAVPPGE